jgi:hypothetical protein
VLLCADNEIQTQGQKGVGLKIGAFSGSWGTVAGAFAGNVDYAVAAFYDLEGKIGDALKGDKSKSVVLPLPTCLLFSFGYSSWRCSDASLCDQ